MSKSSDPGSAAVLLCAVAALALFLALPGLLVVFGAARVVGAVLDAGQLWVFGGTISAVFVLVAWLHRGPLFALGWYGGACLISAWVVAFFHWGMHADWPADLVVLAIPGVRG